MRHRSLPAELPLAKGTKYLEQCNCCSCACCHNKVLSKAVSTVVSANANCCNIDSKTDAVQHRGKVASDRLFLQSAIAVMPGSKEITKTLLLAL